MSRQRYECARCERLVSAVVVVEGIATRDKGAETWEPFQVCEACHREMVPRRGVSPSGRSKRLVSTKPEQIQLFGEGVNHG